MQRASRGMSCRRTFLQRCTHGPVAASFEACHPWRWLVFEVARSPASPSASVRRWPFGQSRLAVRRHRRQLHGLRCLGACRDLLNPVTPPPHLGLAFGVLAEPSGARSPRGGRILPLLELRPCDGPSPDGPVNVHSRRIETLLRPTVATPPVSLRPRGFSPPRRFPPFTASGMSQPVPGLGFARFRADRSSKPKLLGLCPSSPLARHPAKVSSSSAAVPHRCGLLPSCRSSPARPRGRARASLRPRPKTR